MPKWQPNGAFWVGYFMVVPLLWWMCLCKQVQIWLISIFPWFSKPFILKITTSESKYAPIHAHVNFHLAFGLKLPVHWIFLLELCQIRRTHYVEKMLQLMSQPRKTWITLWKSEKGCWRNQFQGWTWRQVSLSQLKMVALMKRLLKGMEWN